MKIYLIMSSIHNSMQIDYQNMYYLLLIGTCVQVLTFQRSDIFYTYEQKFVIKRFLQCGILTLNFFVLNFHNQTNLLVPTVNLYSDMKI